MEVLNNGYKALSTNYLKPTPRILKMIADLGLLIGLIVEASPEFPNKEWVVFGALAFKLLTNFVVEHQPEVKQDEPKQV
jgi:hypothetical protein